jgi:hypothetical protein
MNLMTSKIVTLREHRDALTSQLVYTLGDVDDLKENSAHLEERISVMTSQRISLSEHSVSGDDIDVMKNGAVLEERITLSSRRRNADREHREELKLQLSCTVADIEVTKKDAAELNQQIYLATLSHKMETLLY